ncbi:hypothetical protein ALC57_15130 [Trachymyrmex cornetzi]|uniref:Uncharacterized protein n=1 Tax=Trachymyrmex cornetzi TaxID=471704 RepID=A0A151IXA2_9HYME|nr:hypothetical protein ALC57_15130 [Trachymyrmex cornetzi]
MDNSENREKVVKEIAKTSDSIRKKDCALKTGKMEEDIAFGRHFKPIIDSLKRIVENTADFSKDPIMTETIFSEEDEETKPERKRPSALYDNPIQASTPVKSSIRHLHQAFEGQEKLQTNYGPLGQKYMKAVLSGKKAVNIDIVYRVYFSDEGTMLGDKRITLHKNDDIIIDGRVKIATPARYKVGDLVRVSKFKTVFDKHFRHEAGRQGTFGTIIQRGKVIAGVVVSIVSRESSTPNVRGKGTNANQTP